MVVPFPVLSAEEGGRPLPETVVAAKVFFASGLDRFGVAGILRGFLMVEGGWSCGDPSAVSSTGGSRTAAVGVLGVFLGLPLLFLLLGAFSGMGGVGRIISGVASMIFLEDDCCDCEGLLGVGVACVGLSCVLNHHVILFLRRVFLPGTAILLCCKEQESKFSSLTALLAQVLETVLSFSGDSNDGEACVVWTGCTTLLTFVFSSLLLLQTSGSMEGVAGLFGNPVRWEDFSTFQTLFTVPLPPK